MLSKNFSEVYGMELNVLVTKLENCIRAYPGDIILSDSVEHVNLPEAVIEWYKTIVSIVEEVDVLCNDFDALDIFRSVLKGQ